MPSIRLRMWRHSATLLLCCIISSPPTLSAQDTAKDPGDQITISRFGYRATKAVSSMGTYAVARELGMSRELAAAVGTVTPMVVSKALYLAQGSPTGRWPNAGFLLKDMASELAEGSAPLWMTWARRGGRSQWWRWPVATIAYGTAVLATWNWGTP